MIFYHKYILMIHFLCTNFQPFVYIPTGVFTNSIKPDISGFLHNFIQPTTLYIWIPFQFLLFLQSTYTPLTTLFISTPHHYPSQQYHDSSIFLHFWPSCFFRRFHLFLQQHIFYHISLKLIVLWYFWVSPLGTSKLKVTLKSIRVRQEHLSISHGMTLIVNSGKLR